MRVVISKTGHFVGRLSLQIIPSVTASVVGGYLLAQLVPQKDSAPAASAVTAAKPSANTPVVNDRAPIRVIPAPRSAQATEPPAEVKRAEVKAAEKPAEARSEAKEAKKVAAVPPAAEPKQARVKPAADSTVQQVYTPEPYTPEADLPQVASQPVLAMGPAPKPAPPVSAPVAVAASAPALPAPTNVGPAAGVAAPTALSPVIVNAPRPAAQPAPVETAAAEPAQKREPGVFSALSSAAGTAANVTGNTINWVIDLPGKLIGQDSQDGRDQQASQPRRFM